MYGFPMTSECLSFELPSMSLLDRSEKSHAKAMFVSREKKLQQNKWWQAWHFQIQNKGLFCYNLSLLASTFNSLTTGQILKFHESQRHFFVKRRRWGLWSFAVTVSVSHFDLVSDLIKFPAHIPWMKPDQATYDDSRFVSNIDIYDIWYMYTSFMPYTLMRHLKINLGAIIDIPML